MPKSGIELTLLAYYDNFSFSGAKVTKSFFYVHPLFYEYGIRFLYWGGLKRLHKMVGNAESLFEPACGYGRIRRFLPQQCRYSGIDLNEAFIRYGQKKGLNISLGNIFNESLYLPSQIILLCDILHHLSVQEMKQLLELAIRFAQKKIIIVEPYFVSIASSPSFVSRILAHLFRTADSDGINQIENWLSEKEYDLLFELIRFFPNVQNLNIRKHRFHYFVEVLLTNGIEA